MGRRGGTRQKQPSSESPIAQGCCRVSSLSQRGVSLQPCAKLCRARSFLGPAPTSSTAPGMPAQGSVLLPSVGLTPRKVHTALQPCSAARECLFQWLAVLWRARAARSGCLLRLTRCASLAGWNWHLSTTDPNWPDLNVILPLSLTQLSVPTRTHQACTSAHWEVSLLNQCTWDGAREQQQ